MKLSRIFYALGIILILLSSCKKEDTLEVPVGTATYDITVTGMWTSASHPTNYPSGAHFSPVVCMSHNGNVSLFTVGKLATNGIKTMAETGQTGPLDGEIDQYISSGYATLRANGGGISSGTGSATASVHVNGDFPLVSVVSMLAPSPDWFIGLDGFALIRNGVFVSDTIITLNTYDAGTDSGSSFTSDNLASSPADTITKIISPPLGNGVELKPAVASIRIKRRI